MKRKDLIRLLKNNGWQLKRHGNNHDIYSKGKLVEPIPRHRELVSLTEKLSL